MDCPVHRQIEMDEAEGSGATNAQRRIGRLESAVNSDTVSLPNVALDFAPKCLKFNDYKTM